jgi:hypothetical protein
LDIYLLPIYLPPIALPTRHDHCLFKKLSLEAGGILISSGGGGGGGGWGTPLSSDEGSSNSVVGAECIERFDNWSD